MEKTLYRELSRSRSTCDMRSKIRDWSNNCISGTVAAAYLVQIVECVANGTARPLPTWKNPLGETVH